MKSFSESDKLQIEARGLSLADANRQLQQLREGFPWLDIVAPATVGRGIHSLSGEQIDDAVRYSDEAQVDGRCKFVPASGAASRMFKDIFSALDTLRSGGQVADGHAAAVLADNISRFAFYDSTLFAPCQDVAEFRRKVCEALLEPSGLGYGSKPKGVLKFHRYPTETRTAIAEHMVEGAEYMRSSDGKVRMTVTISPEHQSLFEDAVESVRTMYEQRYGVEYDIKFTFQSPATDTVALDADGDPFHTSDGRLLFRPAGHGALIHNLNEVQEELVSIKNIDNVSVERLLPLTARYKKALMGVCLQLRDRVRGYLYALDQVVDFHVAPPFVPFIPGYTPRPFDPCETEECQKLCGEIEDFLEEEFCIEMPVAADCRARVEVLYEKLHRPLRVCGMVKNQGEPGGGPFIIREKDGSTSLQILESVQIDKSNPEAVAALQSATHFNPVDIVCCLRDEKGEKYNLTDFVDSDCGFISSKSFQGKELKALELPGLWNGAMSRWNTAFLEVPLETFNPVKVVNDLLRDEHQG